MNTGLHTRTSKAADLDVMLTDDPFAAIYFRWRQASGSRSTVQVAATQPHSVQLIRQDNQFLSHNGLPNSQAPYLIVGHFEKALRIPEALHY